jgi:hypothetical protein
MRTLSRPMFNWGGPVKQGIMHGIREPYKGGGAALVGNPAFPKTGGREHHYTWIPSAINALRAVGTGLKAGRALAPGTLGKWGRFKSLLSPSGRFRDYGGKVPLYGKGKQLVPYGATADTSGKLGIWQALKDPRRLGMAMRENPITALSLATVPASGVDLAREHGADVAKGGWNLAKRYAAGLIPGDQSHWYTDPEPPTGIQKPGGYPEATVTGKGKLKELTKAQKDKWADAQRGKRLNNLLDIMGYDASKKTAVADALIDASKIVSERGTLDRKNITSELINPIIQATSKRLDKPGQIREAVGLMMAKGEIEKDLYKWKPGTALKNAQDMADTLKIPVEEALRRQSGMPTNVAEDLQQLQILKKGAVLTAPEIEQRTRLFANQNDEELKQVISADQLKKGGLEETDSIEIVQGLLTGDPAKDDGYYQVDKEVIKVTNGVPKKQW